MLLSGKAEIRTAAGANPAHDGFVVLLAARSLASVVGRPPCDVVTSAIAALTGDVNVLCPIDDTTSVEPCLPGWTRQTALIHTWTGKIDWDANAEVFGVRS